MSEVGEGKSREPATGYGTFVSPQTYPYPAGAGFPQPVPPIGFSGIYPPVSASVYPPASAGLYPPKADAASTPPPPVHALHPAAAPCYSHGYQAYCGGGVVVAQGTPLRMERLPCCGLGIGWILFIAGFFFAAIPWYFGAFILLFLRIDYREKPGYIACTIAAVLAASAVLLGVTKGAAAW